MNLHHEWFGLGCCAAKKDCKRSLSKGPMLMGWECASKTSLSMLFREVDHFSPQALGNRFVFPSQVQGGLYLDILKLFLTKFESFEDSKR